MIKLIEMAKAIRSEVKEIRGRLGNNAWIRLSSGEAKKLKMN
jgi:hypothetical protein